MTHLTENEIQELLEASKHQYENNIPEHVKGCPQCQQNIELFSRLFDVLGGEDHSINIPENFSQSVVQKIEQQEHAFRRNLLFLISICSITFIFGLGLSVYYDLISLDPILAPFQTMLTTLQNTFQGTILNPLQSTFQTKLSLVLSGFLTLFITLIIDKFLIQPKFKMKHPSPIH